MNNTNKPIGQHDLPKTYLKRFSINPQDRKQKSFVWCYSNNQYESQLEEVSIDSKIFKKADFYTIQHEAEPYAFEHLFRIEIEPLYNKIMVEIEKEENLSFECRQNFVLWLYFNKYRNSAHRKNLQRIAKFSSEILFKMEHGKDKYEQFKEKFDLAAKSEAKEIQLLSLVDKKLIEHFDKLAGISHWIILKSNPSNLFLTNDNPGFSVNMDMDMGNPDLSTINSQYAFNGKAYNYFMLSPHYCLLISPFWAGTPKDLSLRNQKIEFTKTNNRHIEFINRCTVMTRTNLLISCKKEVLQKYIQKESSHDR